MIITGAAWAVYVLTAGAHAADGTHFPPLDFDATTNAKHWLQTATGVISAGGEFITLGGEVVTFGGESITL